MLDSGIIREFSNVGSLTAARAFPGFPSRSGPKRRNLAARGAIRFDLHPGDLLSLSASGAPADVVVLAFDGRGKDALGDLNLSADAGLDPDEFDSAALTGWTEGRGIAFRKFRGARVRVEEPRVFGSRSGCAAWVVYPTGRTALIEGDLGGELAVTVKRAPGGSPDLPEPLGEVRDEFTVRRGSARAYELAEGEIVQVIDVEGQQCSDFMAFLSESLERGEEAMIDTTATRSMTRRSFPQPGLLDKFFDHGMRPMLRVLQDTCGRHDTFGLACTARGYEERGFPGHLNCSDNMSEALAPYGARRRAAWPAINFFWNTWVDPGTHLIHTEESHSRPGDYVAMQAMEPLVCVSTACPDDIDPINGWNPTDVHVRIYRPDAPIRRAVAYRAKEDAPMSISRESAFHSRTSALTRDFAPKRDLWSPVSFPATGTIGEYWACREKATLQDMSGLRKYDVVGPDAERLLQRATTRDMARLPVWRGTYALMCDDTGAIIDDGTLFRLGPDLFRWCCGTEESARSLDALARDERLNARLHDMSDSLVNLALQGPRSREILDGLAFAQPHLPALEDLKWFGATVARLRHRDGAPFMLTRTGYTGELGYELFCSPADAEAIWDALASAGEEIGLVPMGDAALEIIRIEAGMAAAGAEFVPGCDAFEAGLGFAVDLGKADFVGKAALERNARCRRRMLKGLLLDCMDLPARGAPVFAGERQVGEVTSAARSPTLERGVAIARLAAEHAAVGNELEVGMMDGRMKRLPCVVADIPFVDPKRERARA